MAGGLAVGRRVRYVGRRDIPRTDRTDKAGRAAGVSLLVGLNLLDVLTTRLVLHHGGVEGNPLSRWLIAHGALGYAKAGVGVMIGLIVMRLPARRASSIALWLVVGFYLAVVVHNAMQLVAR